MGMKALEEGIPREATTLTGALPLKGMTVVSYHAGDSTGRRMDIDSLHDCPSPRAAIASGPRFPCPTKKGKIAAILL